MAFVVKNPTPFVLRDALVRFKNNATDGFDFEKAVSSIEFVKNGGGTVDFFGLDPDASYSFPTTSAYVCNLSFAQDWEDEDSLSRYMYENDGAEQDILFEPVRGGQGFEATIVLTAPSIGGGVNAVAVSTVACGAKGKPTLAA